MTGISKRSIVNVSKYVEGKIIEDLNLKMIERMTRTEIIRTKDEEDKEEERVEMIERACGKIDMSKGLVWMVVKISGGKIMLYIIRV